MAVESQTPGLQEKLAAGALVKAPLLLSIAILLLGGVAAPLFTRIYFLHGGERVWLTTLLQSCAFPILFLPLSAWYFRRKDWSGGAGVFSVTARAAASCVVLGVGTGLSAYMYACGAGALPVSTSTLLMSTQLAFTAGFAFLIVRQRFTAYSINAIVLLVLGSLVLGMQAGGDRPAGESSRKYYLGFFVTLGGVSLMGLLMPLIELTYLKMNRKATPLLVMEVQLVMAVSATAFSVVGMLANKDFLAIPREAKEYGLGEAKYYLVLAACAMSWQLLSVGYLGVIACSSSLVAGIVGAVLVPLGEILPVLVLHERFNGGKVVAVALSVWGLVSYLYGEYKKQKVTTDEGFELPTSP